MTTPDQLLMMDRLLAALRRSWWILAVCVVLGLVGGFAVARSSTKRYTATASLLFSISPALQQLSGATPNDTTSPAQGVQDTNVLLAQLAAKGPVAARTAHLVGGGVTPADVTDAVAVAQASDTEVVSVAATSSSPHQAREIANTFTQQFIASQRRRARHSYRSALTTIDRQLSALTPSQRQQAAGLELEQRAQSLASEAVLSGGGISVAHAAALPSAPSSPDTKRLIVVGALLGIAAGLMIVVLRERLDRGVRSPERLAELHGAPLLGVIPDDAAVTSAATIPDSAGPAAASARLRARLRSVGLERDLRTVAVVSASAGEGTSTIAFDLALAATRAGTTTLLIEADLRRPGLSAALKLPGDPGLSAVLSRGCHLDEAVQSMALRVAGHGHIGGLLDVIPAGSIPSPNPDELLEGRTMRDALDQARGRYGLIVIDTPALDAVPDALALLSAVDGVLVVGDVRRARADLAAAVHEALTGIGAPVLGVVANRVCARHTSGYATVPVPAASPSDLHLKVLNGDGPRVRAAVAADAADDSWQ